MATKKTPKVPKRDLVANPYTKAELIASAIQQYFDYNSDALTLIPTTTYQFAIGEKVQYGALKDCNVEQVLHDGRFILINYHNTGNTYGQPYDKGRAYILVPWVSVHPLSTIKETKFARKRQIYGYTQSHLDCVVGRAYNSGFWDDVTYQRDYVWTMEDKVRLLDSIFNGYDIGKFVFVIHPYPENRVEVLDGKQRLNAITQYKEGRYPYRGFYWNELSWVDKRMFNSVMMQFVDIDAERLSVADRLDIFLSLNRGGVPQTEEHIAKVQAMFEEELKKEK